VWRRAGAGLAAERIEQTEGRGRLEEWGGRSTMCGLYGEVGGDAGGWGGDEKSRV